jgi:hypothetical protein
MSVTSHPRTGAQAAIALAVILQLFLAACDGPQAGGSTDNERVVASEKGAEDPEEAGQTSDAFSDSGCMNRYFPLARTVTPPAEVRFYCAAPWNQASFARVRKILDQAGIDVVGIAVRGTAPQNKSAMETLAPLALDQADQGPPGMGALYRAFKVLPLLEAIRQGSDAEVFASLAPEDLAALRRAASALDWNAPALEAGSAEQPALALSANATLADVPNVILTIAR